MEVPAAPAAVAAVEEERDFGLADLLQQAPGPNGGLAHALPLARQVREDLARWEAVAQDGDADPLEVWKAKASRMPRLAALAAHVFSVPGSSAGLARAFSHVKNAIGPKRPRLDPDMACDILFAHENVARDVF